tara:strand:- start:551 stop:937 length:387 start_codon:yes stop_codon:yes gene_type:complete
MRRFTDYFIFLSLLGAGVSCETKESPEIPPPNPMEFVWESIRGEINHLEASHATLKDWRQAAGEEQQLNTADETRAFLEGTGLSSNDIDHATSSFSTAAKVIHFGFDCNYHALVFFDQADRASFVINW